MRTSEFGLPGPDLDSPLSSRQNIRLIIADSHPLVRSGMRQCLEREPGFQVVAEANDCWESIRLVDVSDVDVLVMNVNGTADHLEAIKQIREKRPELAVLVFSAHDDLEYAMQMLKAGVAGYLLDTASGEEIVHAVRAVADHKLVLHLAIARDLVTQFPSPPPSHQVRPFEGEQLTPRELEVLYFVGQGLTNEQVARRLGLSLRTVKGHLVSIFSKLQVRSRTEAALRAVRNGLMDSEFTL
jgi:DNA-binding NarL/FixJ family response regulator